MSSQNSVEQKQLETKQQDSKQQVEQPIVSREKLLEAGTYFGHKVSRWNPKMKQYIYGRRVGIHIIDIAKTQKTLEYAYKLLNKMAQKPVSFIWVGTKKQAKNAIKEAAARTNSVYVSERWLGGTLTNSQTIFKSVKELERLEELQKNGYKGYTKKEGLLYDKKIAKLQKNLNGIRKLAAGAQMPNVMIVASPIEDEIAIKEARRKGIKVFAIHDTNSNPDLSDFVIPANDDTAKSITLIITILADAIASARGGKQIFAYKPNEEVILPEDPRAAENKERRLAAARAQAQSQTQATQESNSSSEVKEDK